MESISQTEQDARANELEAEGRRVQVCSPRPTTPVLSSCSCSHSKRHLCVFDSHFCMYRPNTESRLGWKLYDTGSTLLQISGGTLMPCAILGVGSLRSDSRHHSVSPSPHQSYKPLPRLLIATYAHKMQTWRLRVEPVCCMAMLHRSCVVAHDSGGASVHRALAARPYGRGGRGSLLRHLFVQARFRACRVELRGQGACQGARQGAGAFVQ